MPSLEHALFGKIRLGDTVRRSPPQALLQNSCIPYPLLTVTYQYNIIASVINGASKSYIDPCIAHLRACANMPHMSLTSRLLHPSRVFLQHNTTSHMAKHNKRQQNTTFSKDSSRASYLFSTTYTGEARPGRVRRQRPLPAVNYGYRKMQGGLRSLRQNPNRYNGSPILFFGEPAFHCSLERPNRSNFAKIEGLAANFAAQVIDGCHFRGLPGGLEGV
jgi:hypothetical protein